MINRVRKYIRRHGMLKRGDRVIVGVSGGADSMALLSVLHRLRDELAVTLVVAHMNHGLRGSESDADGDLVGNTAATLGLPFHERRVDIGSLAKREGLSLEDMARRERYGFFHHLLQDLPADKITLGHQRHDQAETVLMNLIRGAGSRGLRGILPVRENVLIRPFLDVSREEILAYLDGESIPYREDSSNQSGEFLRNRIRLDLMGQMKRYNPRIEARLCDLAETMRLENDFLERETTGALKRLGVSGGGDTALRIGDMRELHGAMQRRVIKAVLERRSQRQNGISRVHVDAVARLLERGRVGQMLSLPFDTEVFRQYDGLLFREKTRRRSKRAESGERNGARPPGIVPPFQGAFRYRIDDIPANILIEETGMRLRLTKTGAPACDLKSENVVLLDYKKITFPCEIRNIRSGDRFRPLGMGGTKKLRTFFADRKVPREIRKETPLLVDGEKVLCVVGITVSDTAKITPSTKTCLKIEMI
ncbi:MAG: tRNA lysidine(34) synthetase TilS [Syntrophales bacterium]|jgi:tRNA(Ile)-lysidine synthase|nr:tRNA lysidine(34) synthetase TilS [Syntrophales bacterium]